MMTKLTLLAFIPMLLSLIAISFAASTEEEQCHGLEPMPSVSDYLGASLDYEVADRICCHNHHYAEPRGYLEWSEVDLFSRLDPTVETIFYDSVCGIPLFVAPRGRTFDDFREESIHHGWPSFRPEEMVSENVIIHPNGRMESKCLTHLGHNLPSGGVDRYCIDLVCIAGMPIDTEGGSGTSEDVPEGVVTADEFDAATYTSSAEQVSGKNLNSQRNTIIGIVVAVCVVVLGMVLFFVRRARNKNEKARKPTESPISTDQKAAVMGDGTSDNMSGKTEEGSNESP